MFTIKQLEAKSTSPAGIAPGAEFGGTFTVPSYRSGLFLDPKVRACFERGERVARVRARRQNKSAARATCVWKVRAQS